MNNISEIPALMIEMLDTSKAFVKGMELVKKAEEETPTADVQEVKHAKNLCEDYPSLFECSLCNWCDDDTTTGSTSVYNYCPNCGAKMDGGRDET